MSETVIHTYTARARHDGEFWVITIEGLDDDGREHHTQAKRFEGEAERMARDYIACWLDVDIETVAVRVRIG